MINDIMAAADYNHNNNIDIIDKENILILSVIKKIIFKI